MSPSDMSPVPLKISQVEKGAELLAQVFQSDPMMEFLVADSSRMLNKPKRFYQANIRIGLLYGEVYATPTMDGIAVWLGPGNTDFTFGQMLRSGLLLSTLSMGLKSLARFMQSYKVVMELTSQSISRPHWLLLFLGVEPSQQGKGIGGTLIQPILNQADAEGVPCYLESSNERNLTFYKRHGFKIVGDVQIAEDGPRMWAMLREPVK